MSFEDILFNENLDIIKIKYGENDNNFEFINDNNFEIICLKEKLEVAKWMYQINPNINLNEKVFINACQKNNLELVKFLFPLKEWVIEIPEEIDDIYDDENALCFCCRHGYLEIVKYIVGTNTIDLRLKNDEAFQLACQEGHVELVKWLYQLDPTIDLSIDNEIILERACFYNNGNIELIKWIFSIRTDFSGVNFQDLYYTACQYNFEIAKLIFRKDPTINILGYNYKEFYNLCDSNNLENIKWLDRNSIRPRSRIPMSVYKNAFLKNYNIEVSKWLLEKIETVDINYKKISKKRQKLYINKFTNLYDFNNDKYLNWLLNIYDKYFNFDDYFFLQILKKVKKIQIIRKIYSIRPNVNISELLEDLCIKNQIKTVTKLLDLKPSIVKTEYFEKATNIILNNGYLELSRLFYRYDPNILNNFNIIDSFVFEEGNSGFIKWILSLKPDIKIDELSFINVCQSSNLDLLKFLLKIRPNLDISSNNEAAFRIACVNSNINIVKFLLEKKPDINISANNNEGFLQSAYYNNLELMKYLIKIKPNLNICAGHYSAFIYCCKYDNIDMFKYLVSLLPEINFSMDDEIFFRTACSSNSKNIMIFLLENHQNLDIEVSDNYIIKTLLEWGMESILKLVIDKYPNIKIPDVDFFKNNHQILNFKIINLLLKLELSIELYDLFFLRVCSFWYDEYAITLINIIKTKYPDRYFYDIDNGIFVDYGIKKTIEKFISKSEINYILEECLICQEIESNVKTDCNHYFCEECILSWLNRNKDSCPYCRSNLQVENLVKLIL